MKRIIRVLAGLLAVFFVAFSVSTSAVAVNQSVATNGNQKIKITIKVVDENRAALEGATVTLTARDLGLFAKTPNLKLTAVTDSKGVATFKISNTYDRVTGYTVSQDGIETVTANLFDFIGLTWANRTYNVKTVAKTFTVNFHDAAGNVVKDECVKYGNAATAPEAPAYNGSLNYKMEFDGWDTDFSNVTSNLDVNPEYSKTQKETYYQLRLVNPLKDDDASSLAISNSNPKFVDIFTDTDIVENEAGVVEMGDGTAVTIEQQMRISNFKVNVAKSNAGKYYGETNADGTQTVVYVANDDVMYKASFEAIDWNRVKRSSKQIFGTAKEWTPYYTVRFYDEAGNVIDTQKVESGKAAVAPEAPAYNGNLVYKMVFTGWDTSFDNVTAALDVKPVYSKTQANRYYQLRLVNPLNPDNDGASLAISNSNPVFADIFADVDLYENENGVIEMGDGTSVTIEDQMRIDNFKINVASSNASRYYGETNEDGTQTVVFVASADVMYKTSFEAINWNRVKRSAYQIFGTASVWTPYYTVRFYDAAGNVIDTQKVEEGTAATAPEAPVYNGELKYMEKFVGWDADFDAVTGALDVKPVYEATSKKTYYSLRLVNPLKPENDGASLAITNTPPAFVDIFGTADYEENENGVIEMGDGVSVRVEDQMASKINVNINHTQKYYYVEKTEDGEQIIVYVPNADVTMKVNFTDIDWFKIKKSSYQLFGKSDAWTTYYTVRFYDAAGNVIDTQKVEAGTAANAPEAPEYNGTSKYILYFAGWDTEFDSVEGALDIKPVYESPDFSADNKYQPLASFYVNGAEGVDICVTNDSKRITYVFASDDDVSEDANGLIDMGDGTFITLDSLTRAAYNMSFNKYKTRKYHAETIDGVYCVVYIADDGSKKVAAASSIDWKSLVHTENGSIVVYGSIVWEDVAPVVEATEGDEEASADDAKAEESAVSKVEATACENEETTPEAEGTEE